MSVFAKLEPKPKGGDIERKNGIRFMYINADVEEGALSSKLIETLKSDLLKNPINNNVQIEFGGEDKDIAETQTFLSKSFGLSILSFVVTFSFCLAFFTTGSSPSDSM